MKSSVVTAFGENYFQDPSLPVRVARVHRKKGITHPHDLTEIEHVHDFIEIVFILGGNGTQFIQGQEYQVTMGDVFVLQGFQSHYFSECDQLNIVNVMLDPKRNPKLIHPDIHEMTGFQALFILEPQRRHDQRFRNMLRLHFDSLKEIEKGIDALENEINSKREGYRKLVINYLESLLIKISRAYTQLDKPSAKGMVRIQQVIEFIASNFANPLSIERLATVARMSPRHFQRMFKEITGQAPVVYLQNIRIDKACELLKKGDLAVSEVAYQVGFQDRHYFSKCFKQKVGIPPKNFKKGEYF